jgi:hypothetical protein
MTKQYAFLAFTLLATASAATAQCTFTPTVIPDNLILCPDATDTLTTQVYDAYQWYKDGSPIPGATGQNHVVNQVNDAGSTFSVSATLDGCTEMSASVLVDGWVFLLPYVINGGDEPITTGPALEFCQGDTFTLTLSPGYTENIVWTNNGSPIAGEHDPTLIITTSGSYSVSAAPDVCPNSVMGIGVSVDVTFIPPMQPDIVDIGGQICPYPTGNSTQWYLNGQPYSTEDCITPSTPGTYSVYVDYGQNCQIMSGPWLVTGIPEQAQHAFIVAPVPAGNSVRVSWTGIPSPMGGWRLADMQGRTVMTGKFTGTHGMTLDVHALEPGNYLLLAEDTAWAPVRVAVAR